MKSDVDRLYIKRKEADRGLMSVERCVRVEGNSLGFYVANPEENLIRGVAAAVKINTEDTAMSGEFARNKNLSKTFAKRKYMSSSSRECQRKLIKIKLSNGYPKVV